MLFVRLIFYQQPDLGNHFTRVGLKLSFGRPDNIDTPRLPFLVSETMKVVVRTGIACSFDLHVTPVLASLGNHMHTQRLAS